MIWIFILPLNLFSGLVRLAIALMALLVHMIWAVAQILAQGVNRLDRTWQQHTEQRRLH